MRKADFKITLISLTVGATAFYASSALANEPTTISTTGFSLTFPAKWHVEADNKDTILASIRGENPPFININYVILPSSPTEKESDEFREFQKFSIKDALSNDKLKGLIEHSSWHSNQETVKLKNGATVDRQDIEMQDDTHATICTFIRRYHASHTEIYLAFLNPTTCKEGRAEFQALESSFIWKNPK